MGIIIEYQSFDDTTELSVVRIIDINRDIIVPLKRFKNKRWIGKDYIDVWKCDNYILCATKKYTIEEVIEALYGEKILDDDWFYI